MAVRQIHIYLIPKKSLLNKYGQLPTQLELDKDAWIDYFENLDLYTEPYFEDALTIPWWLDLNVNFDSVLPVFKTFGNIQSSAYGMDGLISCGSTDENEIFVWVDTISKIVEKISCRLDLRKPDKGSINKVISLATQFECLLMDSQGRLYQAAVAALFDAIRLSNTNLFFSDTE
jgi:hypothetical protein